MADAKEVVVQVDVLAEQVVLAAALVDPEARARLARRLKPDRFQNATHRAAWEAVCELERRKLEWDPETAARLFGDKVDARYLAELAETRPTAPANLEHAVEGVLWDSARAEATRGPLAALLAALRDRATPPERVKALARQVSESLGSHADRRYHRTSESVVDEMMAELDARRGGQAFYPYGIDALDYDERTRKPRVAPGTKPGQVTVITGVSGSTKSTTAGRIALGQAMLGRPVGYGAWEMGCPVTMELLAIMLLNLKGHGISRTRVLHGEHSDAEHALIRDAGELVGRYVKFMENPFGRQMKERATNEGNLDLVHQYIADTGAEVMVCDLWDRALVDARPEHEKRALERTQGIAQETRCHLILLAQQRKDVELRDDPHPTREGISGSGGWTMISDAEIGVHRPAQYKEMPDTVIEFDLLKRRFGPYPQRIEVDYDPDLGLYKGGTTVPIVRATRQNTAEGELGEFIGADGEVRDPPAGRRKGGRR